MDKAITQLRSRVGDVEASQSKQDERLDALEAQDQDGDSITSRRPAFNKITGEWRIKAGGRTLLKGMKSTREAWGVQPAGQPDSEDHQCHQPWMGQGQHRLE